MRGLLMSSSLVALISVDLEQLELSVIINLKFLSCDKYEAPQISDKPGIYRIVASISGH